MIRKTFKLAILPILFMVFIWSCNLSDQEQDNLLSIKLDDSLSTYDAIRVDILNPDGTVFKDSVFYGKYLPSADHTLKDLNLGASVPANFKIRITGIRGKVNALVISINVTPAGVEAPIILIRVIPPPDSLPPPLDTLKHPVDTTHPPTGIIPKGVTVDSTKLDLYVGGVTQKLKAEVIPSNSGLSVLFQSENDSVAQVLADGTVKAIRAGQTGIKVSPVNYPNLVTTIPVAVKIDVPKLEVGTDRNAKPNEILTFLISVTQDYGDIAALKWSLDGDKIWDDSTKLASASPKHTYDGKDSAVTVFFYVRDTEGNIAEATRKVNIGKLGTLAAPTFTSGTTTSSTRQNKPTWAWLGSPAGSGNFHYVLDNLPATTTKTKSFTSATLTDGEHTFTLRELDSLGNLSDAAISIIKIITQGPVVSITSPAKATVTKEKTINVVWTVKPLIGPLITNNSPENLVGKQGAIKIVRSDSDAVGNKGIDSVIVYRDTIAPATPAFTAATSPALVNVGYTSPVQWVWNRTGAANDTFQVSLNGAPIHVAGTTHVLANPANLTYSLEVREVDSAGNASGPITFSILVDKIAPPAPTVTGTTPVGSPTWSWTAGTGSDGARIFRYKLSTATTYSSESAVTSYSPAGLTTGSYTLQVQEKDQVGNWSGDGVFQIEVDKTGPSVVVGKPTPMGRVTSVNPVISGSVTDDHNIKRIEYRMKTGSYVPLTIVSGSWSFKDSCDIGLNTVHVRAEDQFGNRDSTTINIYRYPNVVFVRKGALGTGKSWEDALGELHQALDSTIPYAAGSQVWVTKGSYQSVPAIAPEMIVRWSDFKILGGFDDKQAAVDTSNRDFSFGATTLGSRIYLGSSTDALNSITIDGFSFISDVRYLGVEANAVSEKITVKNIKVRNLLDDNGILILQSTKNLLENCEFDSNNWADGIGVFLGSESRMINCTFINNGGTGNNAPVGFLSSLFVTGGYYKGNYRYDESSKAISHFDTSRGQLLSIDGAQIQGGESSIYRGVPVAGILFYGANNITIP